MGRPRFTSGPSLFKQKEKQFIFEIFMNYGYARVSTIGQAREGNSLESQEAQLREAGAEKIYADTFTGTKNDRPELTRLLNVIKKGDYFIATKLDRIARDVKQGIELIDKLKDKGVIVNVLNIGIIDNSITGKLIRTIMFAFSEFERDMIIQRTQEGKQIAKMNPNYREGRPKKYTIEQLSHAKELLKTNSYTQVAKMTGISKSTLIRANKQ